ncbi:MAG: LysM peptidoglycan-binding domain-containing protein [Thermodesulfobacteriota bacterium]|nr:LysM peptidoglycan-binding domain-containing protein [Thermodesulfobacteriota bacterium]
MTRNILQNTRALMAVLAVCVVAIIILIVVAATKGGGEVSKKDIQSLQDRLNTLEARMDALAFSGDRIERLATRMDEFEKVASEYGKLEADLMFRISDIEAKLGMAGEKKTGKPVVKEQTAPEKAVPEKPATEKKKSDAKAAASSSAPPSGESAEEGQGDAWYQVRKGDTVYSISRKYDLTVDELKAMNGLDTNRIYPDQKLKVKE